MEDGREGEEGQQWTGGRQNYATDSGRWRRLANTRGSKQVQDPRRGGGMITVFKSEDAIEDERWVYILEVKTNGSKQCLCVMIGLRSVSCRFCRCAKPFRGPWVRCVCGLPSVSSTHDPTVSYTVVNTIPPNSVSNCCTHSGFTVHDTLAVCVLSIIHPIRRTQLRPVQLCGN